MTGAIQAQLDAREVVHGEHVVDAGYVTAERLVKSQQAQIDLVGPTTPEPGWQAKAKEGFAASCFVLDWEAQQATCPQGNPKMIPARVGVHVLGGPAGHLSAGQPQRALAIHAEQARPCRGRPAAAPCSSPDGGMDAVARNRPRHLDDRPQPHRRSASARLRPASGQNGRTHAARGA